MSIDPHAFILLAKIVVAIASSLKDIKFLEKNLHKDLEKISHYAAELQILSPLLERQLQKRFYSFEEEKELKASYESAEHAVKDAKEFLLDLAIRMGYEEIATALRKQLSDEEMKTLQEYHLFSKRNIFVVRLRRFSYTLSRRSSGSPFSDSNRLKKLVTDLESTVERFVRLMVVLRLCRGGLSNSQDHRPLEEFVANAERRLKNNRPVDQVTIRKMTIIRNSGSCSIKARIKDGYLFRGCILEERMFSQTLRADQEKTPEERERLRKSFKKQTEDLVRLFSTECDEEMRCMLGILHCVGYTTLDDHLGHYGILFHVPISMRVRSLREVLIGFDARNPLCKPSPDARKAVAARLARTILLIHKLGLVHKAVNLDAVVLLSPKNQIPNKDDWGSPYLISFGMTRFDKDNSTMEDSGRTLQYNVYHCPERAAFHRIEKHHFLDDIYSLSVVLLEIGLLQPAVKWSETSGYDYNSELLGGDIRGDLPVENEIVERVHEKLLSLAETVLPGEMGLSYASVVLACLNGWDRWTETRDPLRSDERQSQNVDDGANEMSTVKTSKALKTGKRTSIVHMLNNGLSRLVPFLEQEAGDDQGSDQGSEGGQNVEDSSGEAYVVAPVSDDEQDHLSVANSDEIVITLPDESFEGNRTAIERTSFDPHEDADEVVEKRSDGAGDFNERRSEGAPDVMRTNRDTELWAKLLEEVVDKLMGA